MAIPRLQYSDQQRQTIDRWRQQNKLSLRRFARLSTVPYKTVHFFFHGGGVSLGTLDKMIALVTGRTALLK
jgi:hypothetical protein